jgi:hypothetical protein
MRSLKECIRTEKSGCPKRSLRWHQSWTNYGQNGTVTAEVHGFEARLPSAWDAGRLGYDGFPSPLHSGAQRLPRPSWRKVNGSLDRRIIY